MLTADFASAAVLITMGALLGKTSPLQLIVICLLEIVLFALNEWIGLSLLQVVTPPSPDHAFRQSSSAPFCEIRLPLS